MDLLPLYGLLFGVLIGLLTSLRLPVGYADYMAIGILAALDSVFGGLRAGLEGKFDGQIFLSGFFVNTLLAALLTYVGYKLGVDLLMGATVAFSIRLFTNVGIIRRYLVKRSSIQ
ncbi:MAG TPA: small basic family protein [Firmicutes bacterium]|nr:small basic family protein [Bacillota bacterium]